MFGRIDDAKFQTGAAVMENFIASPQGPSRNRPGFAYVNAAKFSNSPARLIPFVYNNTQTMVIELGNQYARFHTQGATLRYSTAGVRAWTPPSGAISYTLTTPGVITWTGHGLTTGDPIRFYVYGSSTPPPLPAGMQLAYTYTVVVIDANTFTLLDASGNAVALSASGGTMAGTNYPGSGSPSVSLSLSPGQSSSQTSSAVGGLANVPVSGGMATLNVNVQVSFYSFQAGGSALFQYSTDGVHWQTFFSQGGTFTGSATVSIPLANLNLLQLRVMAAGGAGPSGSLSITATLTSWSVTIPTSVGPGTTPLRAYRYYLAGSIVSYGGQYYTAALDDQGGLAAPGTNPLIWSLLPSDLSYEIATPFLAADLFFIHYVQSADVMTLVHPNYPPQALKRLSATAWSMTAIAFGPAITPPLNPSALASPGYLAKVSSISTANPALITTAASHTLALGDGVYVTNLTAMIGGVATVQDGFYLVSKVPVDGSGNLIPTQLNLMDYSGNPFSSSGWSSYSATDGTKPITIQYGTKIFNITSNYAVAAIGANGTDQSLLSVTVSALDNLNVPGSYNVISWSAVAGASTYYVFKQKNGLWGFIGQANSTTFTDNNIAPDFSLTPITPDNPFPGVNDYPAAVGYIEQRRCFAGTNNHPQTIWMTNSGTESTFAYSLPSQDTDRISIKVAAREVSLIQHIVPMQQLLLLTGSCEYAEFTTNGGPITPSSVGIRPQSYIGSSAVQPTVVNKSVVYCAARGGHVLELGYNLYANGFIAGDLSLRAAHLFDLLTIVDQTYAKAPLPIVWFVSSSGDLLGLTYVPEQQIGAWHHHETAGRFESIACVAEGSEDRLYAIVNRTINGQTVRYIERMASRLVGNLQDCFFVDAGATYSGASATTISGLTWLEGCTVAVLADGAVQNQKVVTGGAITLDRAASVVQVGLPYTSDLMTLPLTLQVDGFGQGRQKNLNKVWIRLYQSSGVFAGPDENSLVEYKQRTTEAYGVPPVLQTTEAEVVLTPSWNSSGQLLIRQKSPLPLTVVDVTLEVAIGG